VVVRYLQGIQHRPELGFAVSLGWVSRSLVDYVKDITKLLLLVDNLNADIPNTDGRTPLSHAAELDLVEII
jgi:hypothetical protein